MLVQPPAPGPSGWRLARPGQQPRSIAARATPEETLDRFWVARGVNDAGQRSRLVAAGLEAQAAAPVTSTAPEGPVSLPGASSAWLLDDGGAVAADVARVSRGLLDLQRLLGERDDVDLVEMVQREPGLLGARPEAITERLVRLATADGAAGRDVGKLVEAQPWLLLEDGGGDPDMEWTRRLAELETYAAVHGDAHVGFRDGDDAALARWAAKQREEAAGGRLADDQRWCLEGVGFEFKHEQAEWKRWYNELTAFQAVAGHCNPTPLASGDVLFLMNWVSVQRIARRSRVLSAEREAMLDALGFDWSGADALS